MIDNLPRRRGQPAPPAIGFDAMMREYGGPPELGSGINATIAAYRQGHASLARVDMDKTINEAQRLMRKAAVFDAQVKPALQALAVTTEKLREGLRATQAELRKHYDYSGSNLAEISLATEMRAHFRSLDGEARLRAVQTAINEFDTVTLRALSGAPSVLSGVPEAIHTLAREKLLNIVAPEALAKSKSLADAIAFANNFQDQMLQAVADSVDFESAAEISKNAAA